MAMTGQFGQEEKQTTLLDGLAVIFSRGLAIFCLIFALQYWAMVLGFLPGPISQFDQLPQHWQVASAVLSVLMPVVALGLWGLFAWGFVVWFFAILVEVAMFAWFSHLFGTNPTKLIFHGLCFLLFLTFLALKAARARKDPRRF